MVTRPPTPPKPPSSARAFESLTLSQQLLEIVGKLAHIADVMAAKEKNNDA
jgi:hypothetical protein